MKKKLFLLLAIPALLFSGCGKKDKTDNTVAPQQSEQAVQVQIRVDGGYIQCKLDGSSEWINVIALEDLKGLPGDSGADAEGTVKTITNAYIEKDVDVVKLETSTLILEYSNGDVCKYELKKEPLVSYFDYESVYDDCLANIPESLDGKLHEKLYYTIRFKGFSGPSSTLDLPIEVKPNEILGEVNYGEAGIYRVLFKRFDACYFSGTIKIYKDDGVAVKTYGGTIMPYKVPKTSDSQTIPEMWYSWQTPKGEYRARKFTAEELNGIDFSTVGKKEITHEFLDIYNEKCALADPYFEVYDSSDTTLKTHSFKLTNGVVETVLELGAAGNKGTLGFAYDDHSASGAYFNTAASICKYGADGTQYYSPLTMDEFEDSDVAALMSCESEQTFDLRFKANNACFLKVFAKSKTEFSVPDSGFDAYKDVPIKKENGVYKVYGNATECLKDSTGVMRYKEINLDEILHNPENVARFKDPDNPTFDDIDGEGRLSFKTLGGNTVNLFVYESVEDCPDIENVNSNFVHGNFEMGKELPKEPFDVRYENEKRFLVNDCGYTYLMAPVAGYKIVKDDEMISFATMDKTKYDLDTSTPGYKLAGFTGAGGSELAFLFNVYDPDVMEYYFEGKVAGSNIDDINCGNHEVTTTFDEGATRSDVIDYLVGEYISIIRLDSNSVDVVKITKDMIYLNCDNECLDIGVTYGCVYYKGAYVTLYIEVRPLAYMSPICALKFDEDIVDTMLYEFGDFEIEDDYKINSYGELFINDSFAGYLKFLGFADEEETHKYAVLQIYGNILVYCVVSIGTNPFTYVISKLDSKYLGNEVVSGVQEYPEEGATLSFVLYDSGFAEIKTIYEAQEFSFISDYTKLSNGDYWVHVYESGTIIHIYDTYAYINLEPLI